MRKLFVVCCLLCLTGFWGCDKNKGKEATLSNFIDSTKTSVVELESDSANDNEEMEEVEVAAGSSNN